MKLNKKHRTFLWDLGNGLVAVIITHFSKIDYYYAPLILAILSAITKTVNKAFNPNYGKI